MDAQNGGVEGVPSLEKVIILTRRYGQSVDYAIEFTCAEPPRRVAGCRRPFRAFGICCDHPFHNGNTRTALVTMLVHLDNNQQIPPCTANARARLIRRPRHTGDAGVCTIEALSPQAARS